MTLYFHNGTTISLLVIFVNFGALAPQDFILWKNWGVYYFLIFIMKIQLVKVRWYFSIFTLRNVVIW